MPTIESAGGAPAVEPPANAVAANGALLSFMDDGVPGNVGPANVAVGTDNFLEFWPYFAGADVSGQNRIYTVNDKSQLLAFADDGAPGNVANPVIVGNSGWDQYRPLFAGHNTLGESRIYGVNLEGQLVSFANTGAPGSVGPASVTVGADGWNQFKFVFAGLNGPGASRIYAVNGDGDLLAYSDNGKTGNVGHPVAVGVGGWDQFTMLFAGANAAGENRIYAVNQAGQLLSYSDSGAHGNVAHPVVVGLGAWGQFATVFAGRNTVGENRIYGVTNPPPTPTPTPTPPPTPTPTPSGPSLLAAVGPLPQNPSNSGLRIEGGNFGASETVEITVDWEVAGEQSALYPVTAQTNSLGYFQVWFPGVTADGLCPISVPDGQPQPAQNFSVSATGVTSRKKASASAGPFTCG